MIDYYKFVRSLQYTVHTNRIPGPDPYPDLEFYSDHDPDPNPAPNPDPNPDPSPDPNPDRDPDFNPDL